MLHKADSKDNLYYKVFRGAFKDSPEGVMQEVRICIRTKIRPNKCNCWVLVSSASS